MSTQGMKCQTLSNSLLKQEGESRSSRDTPSGSTNYNAKGSKWAISTNFETLCNLTAGSSGKSSRDPSPRREMTTSLEQDKDKYDKSRRREMKNEKMGSKGGYNDTEPRRHVESERISDSRLRDAEWVVRERKPEYDASKQDMKKKRKKGDTFPRIKNGDRDPDPRVMPPEMEKERRHGHRPKREETQFWEEKIDKYKIRMRRKEDGKSPGRRPTEDERAQKRELYKMSGVEFRDTTRETIDRQDMRDRVAARRREDMRLDLDERNARMNSPQRTEREMYGRTQGRTVAKSEGDIDERRDKMRDRRGEEGDYMSKMQHNRDRDRHSGRGTEAERPRRKEEATFDRCTETDRRIARQVDKERERQMETRKDFSGYRREDDQIRRERRAREMLERREHATAERRNRSTSDPDPRVPPRVQSNRELTSSKDDENIRRDRAFYEERGPMTNWAAEIERIKEIPKKHRGGNTRIEQERRRMWLEPQKDRNSADEDRERYRRWKDREREKEMDVKSQAERARDVQRIKAEPNERDFDQRSHEGRHRGANGNDERTENGRKTFREGKGHLSDSDGRTGRKLQGCVEGENVVDDNKESGTEEEGGGDYLVRSGSEGGSDAGWMQDRDRMLSVENSSGGDEEDEREEEDKNVLCEDPTSASSKSFEGDERKEDWVTKKKVTDEDEQGRQQNSNIIFSVTGQSHPQSEATQLSLSENDEVGGAEIDEANMEKHTQRSHDITHENPQLTSSETDEQPVLTNRDKESDHSTSRFTTEDAKEDVQCEASQKLQDEELGGGNKSKEGPCVKIRPMKRDSQTEKLLKRWREQTNEPNTSEQTRPLLEDINTESMSPEEIERIQIRMSRVWATSEEPKRHSQAAHMKWAKDVMRLYMGNSEEQVEDQNTGPREDQGVAGSEYHQEPQVVSQVSFELPTVILTRDDHLAPDLEEELGGMRQADMQADQATAMHVVTNTYTHTDTRPSTAMKEDRAKNQTTEPSSQGQLDEADIDELRKSGTDVYIEEEEEWYLTGTNMLYKPNSCPTLYCDFESDFKTPPTKAKSKSVVDEISQSVEERQTDKEVTEAEVEKMIGEMEEETEEGETDAEKRAVAETDACSVEDYGPKSRFRRRGIRLPTKRRNGECEKVEEEEGVGRDRRTRVFFTTDNDDHSKSWGGMELRNVLDEIKKSQKSHGFFKDTQLYQQYIDTTQEFEILRSRSDVLSTFEDASLSPAPSPPPSRRPLPPLPSQPHLHSLSHTGSVTSAKNLPLPELPNTERRPSSPRLSISLSQSSLLWRELEDVRYSPDLELLTEDQRRLQEVRFEVVTSEASYCRSLDIVVDHFVKSKQLGQLLTTQDKNWLFSRLADVRTISRRFLSMLEQRMESDIMRFTVCDIIAEHCPRFRCVYVPYLTNQSYQDATYQKLMNGNPGFKQVVETLEKSQVCERLPLRSFLVLPFQRITRIKLLVQNIVKRTTPGTEEATHAIRALKLLEKMIRESNESISQMKNLESLVALNSKVNFECKTLPLVSQSRRLVREGAITKLSNSLKEPEKSIYLHLFNDYLLFSVPKEGGRFTVINHYPVTELCAEDCPVKLDTLQKNLFRLRTKQNLLLLRADSASDKLRWISAISPPQPIELSSVQDCAQMQCIRAYVAQQPDELSLEKADVILVHQDCDNWVEGTKLSDLHRGWMPKSHLEAIVNPKVRKRNLSDALKVTNATATA
nr:trichohyalin isoform X1 [Nothobranchius furzeri]